MKFIYKGKVYDSWEKYQEYLDSEAEIILQKKIEFGKVIMVMIAIVVVIKLIVG